MPKNLFSLCVQIGRFAFRFKYFLLALCAGVAFGLFLRSVLIGVAVFFAVWLTARLLAYFLRLRTAKNNFRRHEEPFRRMFGPYGQRMLKSAKQNPGVRKWLDEVFSHRRDKVAEAVKQLEILNELAKAGLRGSGLAQEASELALVYGKDRLQKNLFGGDEK